MAADSYSFLDIAALPGVRGRFARGDALLLLSASLDEVLWANGSGAALFGFAEIDTLLDAPAPIGNTAKRQIAATKGFPEIGTDRSVAVRLMSGMSSRVVPFQASALPLPDKATGILLSVPAGGNAAAAAERALAGIAQPGQAAAIVDGDGNALAASAEFAGFDLPPELLRRLVEKAAETDGPLKQKVQAGERVLPAGVARLEDGLNLVIVTDDDFFELPGDILSAEDSNETEVDPGEAVAFLSGSETPEADDGEGVELLLDGEAPDGWYFAEGQAAAEPPATPEERLAALHAAEPLRFSWRTDAEGRLVAVSPEFSAFAGLRPDDLTGRDFGEITDRLSIGGGAEIAELLKGRDTWSGRTVLWPVADGALQVPVDLAALPTYSRGRSFEGFRGFGVARAGDAALSPSQAAEEEAAAPEAMSPAALASEASASMGEPAAPEPSLKDNSDRVVQLLSASRFAAPEAELSPDERHAFLEIGARLKEEEADGQETASAAEAAEAGETATSPSGALSSGNAEGEAPSGAQPSPAETSFDGETAPLATAVETADAEPDRPVPADTVQQGHVEHPFALLNEPEPAGFAPEASQPLQSSEAVLGADEAAAPVQAIDATQDVEHGSAAEQSEDQPAGQPESSGVSDWDGAPTDLLAPLPSEATEGETASETVAAESSAPPPEGLESEQSEARSGDSPAFRQDNAAPDEPAWAPGTESEAAPDANDWIEPIGANDNPEPSLREQQAFDEDAAALATQEEPFAAPQPSASLPAEVSDALEEQTDSDRLAAQAGERLIPGDPEPEQDAERDAFPAEAVSLLEPPAHQSTSDDTLFGLVAHDAVVTGQADEVASPDTEHVSLRDEPEADRLAVPVSSEGLLSDDTAMVQDAAPLAAEQADWIDADTENPIEPAFQAETPAENQDAAFAGTMPEAAHVPDETSGGSETGDASPSPVEASETQPEAGEADIVAQGAADQPDGEPDQDGDEAGLESASFTKRPGEISQPPTALLDTEPEPPAESSPPAEEVDAWTGATALAPSEEPAPATAEEEQPGGDAAEALPESNIAPASEQGAESDSVASDNWEVLGASAAAEQTAAETPQSESALSEAALEGWPTAAPASTDAENERTEAQAALEEQPGTFPGDLASSAEQEDGRNQSLFEPAEHAETVAVGESMENEPLAVLPSLESAAAEFSEAQPSTESVVENGERREEEPVGVVDAEERAESLAEADSSEIQPEPIEPDAAEAAERAAPEVIAPAAADGEFPAQAEAGTMAFVGVPYTDTAVGSAVEFAGSGEAEAAAAEPVSRDMPAVEQGEGADEAAAPTLFESMQTYGSEPAEAAALGLSSAVPPEAEAETTSADPAEEPALRRGQPDTSILDRLPIPVLIHSGDLLHYANPEFLSLADYPSIAAFAEAGGLGCLFTAPWERISEAGDRHLRLRTSGGEEFPVEALLRSVPWRGNKALLLVLRRLEGTPPHEAEDAAELGQRLTEMRAIIDTATDGVVLTAPDGTIRSISRPAEALFGLDSGAAAGWPFGSLFAVESQRAVNDYLQGLVGDGVASVMNDGREVIGREANGGFIPLFMTIGTLPEGSGFCAVLRDVTQWKRAEEELTQSRALAERASSHKTDFLARVSHEIRTPLNAIIGFSELMLDEKFGPVGSDRYRDYLRDINRSGNHVLDLVNDLLDISKIEAGQQEMSYEAVALNDALSEAVATMQPQANRERVIIRSSFASRLPDVVADPRSVRQIALNVLSNAIRFTQAGGQVIVSTAYDSSGDVVMRVRDTGIGMSQPEIEQALKPFKQINSLKRSRGDGTGLGLPLTKAMVEANRARFAISSDPGVGTMVEVTFPATRVLAG